MLTSWRSLKLGQEIEDALKGAVDATDFREALADLGRSEVALSVQRNLKRRTQ